MMRPILEVLGQYSDLQARLCHAISSGTGNAATQLEHLPRRGELLLDDERWEFVRHGAGIRFTRMEDELTVDPHVQPFDHPEGFDSWRIVQYCDSSGIEELATAMGSINLDDEAAIDNGLAELAEAGDLLTVSVEPLLYEIASRGGNS